MHTTRSLYHSPVDTEFIVGIMNIFFFMVKKKFQHISLFFKYTQNMKQQYSLHALSLVAKIIH